MTTGREVFSVRCGLLPRQFVFRRLRPACRLRLRLNKTEPSNAPLVHLSGVRHAFGRHPRSLRVQLRRSAARNDEQEILRPVQTDDVGSGEPSTSQRPDALAGHDPYETTSDTAFASMTMKEIERGLKDISDRVYFGSGEYLPIVGTMRMSYGRLIQLLKARRVKRIYLMADGQIAIVEVPFETHASNYKSDIRYDRRDLSVVYVEQKPEWQMEKMRYYVELPGDLWEDGLFLKLIKQNQYHHTSDNRVKYEWMLKEHQVTCELLVLDPNDAYVFLNQFVGQFLPIAGLIALRGVVGIGDWMIRKFGKRKKDPMAELAEQYARPRAIEFNVADDQGHVNDTGVRFEDVAGIDRVKSSVVEVIKMMRGDEKFDAIGAHAPRGIMLEGPPGTGKTYLAKAMAGEGRMPFYSANGAEFVEMFSGVAASRMRNLFRMARKKAPSIIFIDEIDAIGKARGAGGDSGTSEREQGLMQLLYEMDGIRPRDQVLVVGATNRINLLDPALLRPGRFDRLIYMGRPSEANRLKILQVHATGKPISRAGSDEYKEDAILAETAKLTLGQTGADLANLLNEAAILSVRETNKEDLGPPVITRRHIKDAIEKARLGLPQQKLPDSTAKRFLATVIAGRVVALMLTPGVPLIESVSILPQGNVMGRILFQRQEYGAEGDLWHALTYPGPKVNAVKINEPIGAFEFCAGLLMPFYAGRATEEVIFGHDSLTLSTSGEVSRANDLAHYLVSQSQLHPAFRHIMVKLNMRMGGRPDPTLQGSAPWFERHTTHMLEVAYRRAKQMVEQRQPVIKQVAEMLCTRNNERVTGAEVVDLLDSTPLGKVKTTIESLAFEDLWGEDVVFSNGNGAKPKAWKGSKGSMCFNGGLGNVGQVWFERPVSLNGSGPFHMSVDDARMVADVTIGNLNILDLLAPDTAKARVEELKTELTGFDMVERLEAVRRYRSDPNAPFPPPPPQDLDGYRGSVTPDWSEYLRRQSSKDPVEFKKNMELWREYSSVPRT